LLSPLPCTLQESTPFGDARRKPIEPVGGINRPCIAGPNRLNLRLNS
jgi:hypothetical protein